MALTRNNITSIENPNDITRCLPSLQFESSLTYEERDLLKLRARSHAITVSICAHSVFLVDILSEVRLLRSQLQSSSRKTAMMLQDYNDPNDVLKVGILGGGRLGSQIAHCLLTFGRLNPQNFKISTRRPETLEYLQHKGVDCFYNNKKLVSSVDLLFICILPSQLPGVADEIEGFLSPSTVVYCPSASTTLPKLKQLLNTSNVFKSDFHWTCHCDSILWDYNVNIKKSLEKKDVVELTNPINQTGKGHVALCNERLAEMMICSCVNMASAVGLNQTDMLECINIVILGDSDRTPVPQHILIQQTDFGFNENTPSQPCPTIDLPSIDNKQTKLQEKMKGQEFFLLFRKRYNCVFDELHHLLANG